MDLIKEFYESLKDYFISQNIKNKKSYQLSSNLKDSEKITFINLGVIFNSASSRGEAIYGNGVKKPFGKYYSITYAIIFPKDSNNDLLLAIRVLSELKTINGSKIKLLNSEILFLNPFVNIYIDNFLNKSDEYTLNRVLFIEIEFYLESLQKPKDIKRVKKVDTDIRRV